MPTFKYPQLNSRQGGLIFRPNYYDSAVIMAEDGFTYLADYCHLLHGTHVYFVGFEFERELYAKDLRQANYPIENYPVGSFTSGVVTSIDKWTQLPGWKLTIHSDADSMVIYTTHVQYREDFFVGCNVWFEVGYDTKDWHVAINPVPRLSFDDAWEECYADS